MSRGDRTSVVSSERPDDIRKTERYRWIDYSQLPYFSYIRTMGSNNERTCEMEARNRLKRFPLSVGLEPWIARSVRERLTYGDNGAPKDRRIRD